MNQLLTTASQYLATGISVTLTDNRKVSILNWKDFQTRLATIDELKAKEDKAQGIAIICGAISGNLEVIDIDVKYDLTGNLFKDLMDELGDLADLLVIAKTKSGGYHLYFRCDTIEGNQKLARRAVTAEETAVNPHVKVMVLIETRGEGGYIMSPPTDGYQWIHNDWQDIQTITKEQRDAIFEICRSFNEYLDEPIQVKKSDAEGSFGVSPIDDYNNRGDVVAILNKHGWISVRSTSDKTYLRRPGKDDGISGDFLHSKRWFSVFTTSSQFEPQRAYYPAAVYAILECNGDFNAAVKQLGSQGYGEDLSTHTRKKNLDNFIKKLRENHHDDEDIQTILIKERNLKPKQAKKAVEDSYKTTEATGAFWSRNDKDKLEINKTKLIDFLVENGFYLMAYDVNGNDMRLVNVKDFMIEESSIEKVKKCIFNYVKPIDEEVAAWIIDRHNLINESFLEFLPKIEPELLEDNKTTAYYPFANKVVKITADGIELVDYGQLKKHIWRSAKIDQEIEIEPILFGEEFRIDPDMDVYAQFIRLICNENNERWLAVNTHIGYLLHKYKDPTMAVAIILAEETDNDAKGGGTGKGIFVKAISELVKGETIDGKNFKLDKSFAFQRVGLDTRILAIQDIRKQVDFEGFYSIITEGLTVEKKGQPEIFIPYERSPKIMFTTNYMIPNVGNHAKRRQRVIPFSDFFSPERTPMDVFKHQFFTGWDKGQWKLFYNYLFACCQYYLRKGLIEVPVTDNMHLKSLKNSFGDEFKRWWVDFIQTGLNQSHEFKVLYQSFLASAEVPEHDFSRRRFRKAIDTAALMFGLAVEESNKGPMGGKIIGLNEPKMACKQLI
jgi:hypothetical protein